MLIFWLGLDSALERNLWMKQKWISFETVSHVKSVHENKNDNDKGDSGMTWSHDKQDVWISPHNAMFSLPNYTTTQHPTSQCLYLSFTTKIHQTTQLSLQTLTHHSQPTKFPPLFINIVIKKIKNKNRYFLTLFWVMITVSICTIIFNWQNII